MVLISPLTRWSIRLQQVLSFLCMIWLAPIVIFYLKFYRKHRIRDLNEFRKDVRDKIKAAANRPIIIAANHLTAIDSFIINWALMPWPHYLWYFHRFPWNVPEYANFGHNPFLRLLCYLGKCCFIKRNGSKRHKARVMSRLQFLGMEGESICIFPEGGRSRTGRVDRDAATYGVGEILEEIGNAVVWCIYLRGDSQESYSWLPKKQETFTIKLKALEPHSQHRGRRAARDKTLQIFDQLTKLEQDYFDHRQ
ncbi:lysophospholipid acyltransferase family protein [Pseudobacteriovorax antillogorgiicola]|uniref:Acyltransferase n=1 Tax=Pseudobacteriovorax antillogorgiicola TaxID=1513793 RepID=A0A1Y6B9F2_9BACT|nr:lysophospholipid acyltransferase family protein [Pseudobacteriovorax antillogorgiicola]TCS58682.1 acyltransferase-like protein [Pseudobacteriovorax antillogorgiicola]SME95915.1 Acyltransferase [Pseudobacteriovorax antillogorgiicola]